MKIIFLDVDGVLNDQETKTLIPEEPYIGVDSKYIKRLKKIVKATGAQIVLTSTWRINRTHDGKEFNNSAHYLQEQLEKHGLRYVSSTPVIRWNHRGHEIKKWFEDNNDIEVEGWVVLDDEFFIDFDNEIAPHWVKTCIETEHEFIQGLTEENVEQAIKILNGGIKDV